MIGKVTRRREEKVAAIVAAAWDQARSDGVGGVTLRALAKQVGMRQPSLYEYFDSKNALYDAMFADGNRHFFERLDQLEPVPDSRDAVKAFMRTFVELSLEDDARRMLLFQRPIPGFEPSAESYAYAVRVLERAIELLQAAGLNDRGDVDCFVAMVAGLIEAQASNEPGGDRWVRHLDRLTDLYLDDAMQRRAIP